MSRRRLLITWSVCAALASGLGARMAGQESKAAGEAPGNPVVVLETSAGAITLELFKDRSPASVENFLDYVRAGHYDGTIFHRVIKGFMIQGGGFTPAFERKPTRGPIKNEATNGLKNTRGTVAMARTNQVRSATAEFFINTDDNTQLNHRGYAPDEFGYAVFGRVIAGMPVVDAIENAVTRVVGQMEDVPVEPVVITRAFVK